MSFNSVKTNSSCSSRNSCKNIYNSQINSLLEKFNEPNSKVTSLNDEITKLRSQYKNNIFSDKFITVDYGTIVTEKNINGKDKYLYKCSIDFTKLFDILRYTGKNRFGTNLKSGDTKEGFFVRVRATGDIIVGKVKAQIKKQLTPTSNNNNILKMDTVEWGTKEPNKLIMKMNIKKFYDDILIKKKVLPKIRLSKKKWYMNLKIQTFLKGG